MFSLVLVSVKTEVISEGVIYEWTVLITSNDIVLSLSCKSICVTYDYNKRLDIRAISGSLSLYIYIYPTTTSKTNLEKRWSFWKIQNAWRFMARRGHVIWILKSNCNAVASWICLWIFEGVIRQELANMSFFTHVGYFKNYLTGIKKK
jgi:hypothetical protein